MAVPQSSPGTLPRGGGFVRLCLARWSLKESPHGGEPPTQSFPALVPSGGGLFHALRLPHPKMPHSHFSPPHHPGTSLPRPLRFLLQSQLCSSPAPPAGQPTRHLRAPLCLLGPAKLSSKGAWVQPSEWLGAPPPPALDCRAWEPSPLSRGGRGLARRLGARVLWQEEGRLSMVSSDPV